MTGSKGSMEVRCMANMRKNPRLQAIAPSHPGDPTILDLPEIKKNFWSIFFALRNAHTLNDRTQSISLDLELFSMWNRFLFPCAP